MTDAEIVDLIAELEQCNETMTAAPWYARYGGEPGYIYSSGAKMKIADVPHEVRDDNPRHDSLGICDLRNLLPRLIAALKGNGYEVAAEWRDKFKAAEKVIAERNQMMDAMGKCIEYFAAELAAVRSAIRAPSMATLQPDSVSTECTKTRTE